MKSANARFFHMVCLTCFFFPGHRGVVLRDGDVRAGGAGELAQNVLLRFREVLGRDDRRNESGHAALAADIGDALFLEAKDAAGLSRLGDGELHVAVDRRDDHLRFERRLRKADRHLIEHGGALALEDRVRTHADGHEQVALRAASGPRCQDRAKRWTGRRRCRRGYWRSPCAACGLSRCPGRSHRAADTLLMPWHLGQAPVVWTMPKGERCCMRTPPEPLQSGQTSAVVPLAQPVPCSPEFLDARDGSLFAAEGGLLKGDCDARADIFAALRAVRTLLASAAEHAAEDVAEVAEDVAEIRPVPPMDGSKAAWPNWSYFERLSGDRTKRRTPPRPP